MTLGNDWLATVGTQTWQVTVLIVVVALLARLAAANRPQLAFALWLVVLIKCVTPPLWSSPSGAFCWLQPPRVGEETRSKMDGAKFFGSTPTAPKGHDSSSPGQRPGETGPIEPALSAQRANR